MSIDLHLRCKTRPTKRQIENVLLPMGFKKPPDRISPNEYLWFEKYQSLRGCWLSYEHVSDGDHDRDYAPKGTRIIFTSATYAWRSYYDLRMQNEVIRALRKAFPGSLQNPQYATNRYFDLDGLPQLSRAETRCGLCHVHFHDNVDRLRKLITDIPTIAVRPNPDDRKDDRSIVQNNVCVPFLLSSLETFLRDFFVAYLSENPQRLDEYHGNSQAQISHEDLRKLITGTVSLAEHEARVWNFQNLEDADKAYKSVLKIPLLESLRVYKKQTALKAKTGAKVKPVQINAKRKLNGKFVDIHATVEEFIRLRHRIIHEAHIDTNLSADQLKRYAFAAEMFVKLFAEKLEKGKPAFRIDLGKYTV